MVVAGALTVVVWVGVAVGAVAVGAVVSGAFVVLAGAVVVTVLSLSRGLVRPAAGALVPLSVVVGCEELPPVDDCCDPLLDDGCEPLLVVELGPELPELVWLWLGWLGSDGWLAPVWPPPPEDGWPPPPEDGSPPPEEG